MSAKDDDKYPKKSYCWKDDCKENLGGFQWNDYFVCSTCKEEITEFLYNIIKNRREKEDKKDKK